MKLDQATIEWIEKAIEAAPYGKIVLFIQDKRVMKIHTESRKEIKSIDKA